MNEPEFIHVWAVFTALFGLVFGSFANVLIYRLPRKQSILKPPSHCTECGTLIKPYHNVPIFSYMFLKGRCNHCGALISLRYPLVEALSGLLAVLLLYRFNITPVFFFYAVFAFIMMVHAFIDFEHYLLLDKLNIAGGVIGLGFRIFYPGLSFVEGVFGIAFGGGLLLLIYLLSFVLFKKEGMGFGDVKTGMVCGLFLGPIIVIYMFLLSAVVGLIWSGIWYIVKREKKVIPFGTMMAVSSTLLIFLKKYILNMLF